jgi:hypothetical protein
MEKNKIYFHGNPYPKGHNIIKCIWQGRIDEDETLWFDFHVETDKYTAEDNTEDTEDIADNWQAKAVWGNYNSGKLSSTFWEEEDKGIVIKEANEGLFDINTYLQQPIVVDALPLEDDMDIEDLAFDIFLLGHDSCADHNIVFTKNGNAYDITWTGKIALSYAGDYDFKYNFTLLIEAVSFGGFHYPQAWSQEKATQLFKKHLAGFENYSFEDLNPKSNKREYKLVYKL